MFLPQYSRGWENWAPVIGRIIFGLLFLNAAYFKAPGTEKFALAVSQTGSAGVPLPTLAVALAFFLELLGGLALLVGWKTRIIAPFLAVFILLINLAFFRNLSDPMQLGFFISNLGLIGGLLYISVYGATYAAIAKDRTPKNIS